MTNDYATFKCEWCETQINVGNPFFKCKGFEICRKCMDSSDARPSEDQLIHFICEANEDRERVYGNGATNNSVIGAAEYKLLDFLIEEYFWNGNRLVDDYDDYCFPIEKAIEEHYNMSMEDLFHALENEKVSQKLEEIDTYHGAREILKTYGAKCAKLRKFA